VLTKARIARPHITTGGFEALPLFAGRRTGVPPRVLQDTAAEALKAKLAALRNPNEDVATRKPLKRSMHFKGRDEREGPVAWR